MSINLLKYKSKKAKQSKIASKHILRTKTQLQTTKTLEIDEPANAHLYCLETECREILNETYKYISIETV